MKNLIKSVLVTGGTGLIGRNIIKLLQQSGYRVSLLSRNPKPGGVSSYRWSVGDGYLDPEALAGVDAIIHLAGANVGERRWSASWKKQILESRVTSGQLLFDSLAKMDHQVKTVVSSSAIGYYGFDSDGKSFNEDAPSGTDFLARVTQAWEKSIDQIAELNIRVVKLRIGIVLSREGGAAQKLARPVRWFVGAPLGSGRQIISWIHMQDLCNIFLKALVDDNMHGAYNAVAPNPVSNKLLTQVIARTLKRPLWLPPVPEFVLKIIIGQMAEVLVNGSNISGNRIKETGFKFMFEKVEEAVKDVVGRIETPKK